MSYDREKIENLVKTPKGIFCPHFDFCKYRFVYYGFSGLLLGIALIVTLVLGVQLDIQFTGGTIATYSYTGEISEADFQAAVEEITGYDVEVTGAEDLMSGSASFTVNFPSDVAMDVEEQTALSDALQERFPDNALETSSVNAVSATMGFDFLLKCLVAVGFAAVIMVVYIALRFRKIGGWSAGVFAMLALVHDLCMVYATFIIFRMPLDDNFVAILLVILGYSVNDTIVIYDRVRENERLYGSQLTPSELVNLSINQSFTRAIHTNVTTIGSMIIVCVAAALNGVDSIVTFTLPLIVGLISGSYSTICLCGPSWVLWKEHQAKKAPRKAVKA